MLSFFRRIPLVAALLVVAACDRSDNTPTGPLPLGAQFNSSGTDRFVEETIYDLTGSYTAIECDNGKTSELVALEGRIFERFTYQVNPVGAVHIGIHTMPVGLRGVGVVSGEEYRVSERESASYNQTQMGSVGSYRQVVKLVGRSSHSKYSLVSSGHYTINANGELSVQRDRLVLRCDD